MQQNEDIPDGWDYNPSIFGNRIPTLILASLGVGIAGYLGLYQLHITDTVWDPFFGDGTCKILTSKVSRMLPVPDALLGALGYLADIATGVIGGKQRWKKMPWIVILFGTVVSLLGLVSVLLVILQPVVFGEWCTLCLCSAFISITIVGPAMDEVLATVQYLKSLKSGGEDLSKAFWGKK